MSVAQVIRDRLFANDPFSLAEVRGWMSDTADLDLWAAVYDVLGRGFYRITPEPGMEETCRFLTRYLIRCVHEDVQNESGQVPTGYEAAYGLAACLKHWASKLPATQPVLSDAEQRIAEAYRRADERERDRLLNGMLEHALEAASVRPYFRAWEGDPVLGEPWRMAMEWAVDHGDPAVG